MYSTLPVFDLGSGNLAYTMAYYMENLHEACISENAHSKDRLSILEFLEDLPLRHHSDIENIIKVGGGKKKRGGTYRSNKIVQFFRRNVCRCWSNHYFILTNEGLSWINKYTDSNLQDSVFFDTSLRIRHKSDTDEYKNCIIFITSSRKLKVSLPTQYEMFKWIDFIIEAILANKYCRMNRFDSFAPITENNCAKWYINADKYYHDLSVDLEKAMYKIYITDWWLSPELYLRRPTRKLDGTGWDTFYRLDTTLKRAADRGCVIYVLIYKEFEHALPNQSAYTKKTLKALHKNIHVMRHPGDMIFLWSHHEKMCAIDETVTYMGGLDLCYGRYDTDEYSLTDPGSEGHIHFPGQDYSNVRIKDFKNVDDWEQTLIDRDNNPRMPWRDIAVRLKGEVVKDTVRHFLQYWNFAKRDLSDVGHQLSGEAARKSNKEKSTVGIELPQLPDLVSKIPVQEPVIEPKNNISDNSRIDIKTDITSEMKNKEIFVNPNIFNPFAMYESVIPDQSPAYDEISQPTSKLLNQDYAKNSNINIEKEEGNGMDFDDNFEQTDIQMYKVDVEEANRRSLLKMANMIKNLMNFNG